MSIDINSTFQRAASEHVGAWEPMNLMRSAIICLTCWLSLSSSFGGSNATSLTVPPEPPVWPETFHAVAVQNRSGSLALVDLYYEWQKGRNANLIHSQLGTTLYDIE